MLPTVSDILSRRLERVFVDHPRSVDESYLQHFRFAAGFAIALFSAGAAAAVHAVIPCMCERTASLKVRELYRRIDNRG